MRGLRVVWGLAALAALLVLACFAASRPLVGGFLRATLESRGIDGGDLRIAHLSGNRLIIEDFGDRNQGLYVARIEVSYDWRALIDDGSVHDIAISDAYLRAEVSEDGALLIPALDSADGGGEGGDGFSFETLSVDGVGELESAQGNLYTEFKAHLDSTDGGTVELGVQSDQFGYGAILGREVSGALALVLHDDSRVEMDATFQGDITAPAGRARDVRATAAGEFFGWQEWREGERGPLTGSLSVALDHAFLRVAELSGGPAVLQRDEISLLGGPIDSIVATGAAQLSIADERIDIHIDAPITLIADTGAQMKLSEDFDMPLAQLSDGRTDAAFTYSLEGGDISALGHAQIQRDHAGWFIVGLSRVRSFYGDRLSFEHGDASFTLKASGEEIFADVVTSVDIDALKIGRLEVYDAPFSGALSIAVDTGEKSITARIPIDRCAKLSRARIRLKDQQMETRLRDASICPNADAFNKFSWSGAPNSSFHGVLSAAHAQYRLGQTSLVGLPPTLTFQGVYRPTADETTISTTTITGEISGGRYQINDLGLFSRMSGVYEFALNGEDLTMEMQVKNVNVSQPGPSPFFAPMRIAGVAGLAHDKVDFDFTLASGGNVRLGTGTGLHNVSSGRGRSTLTFDKIDFTDGRLQPEQLAPVLRGIIGKTQGAVSADVEFGWRPDTGAGSADNLDASAKFSLHDLTFEGPTRVVNETIGLSGDIAFSALWPLTTDGVQGIGVAGVDLDALQLNQGQIEFELPGDDSLVIEKAEFPWFDGTLGVYAARASFSGAQANIPLRIEGVNLEDILEFVDVDGLTGEGILSGALPMIVVDGRARIENGVLSSQGGGSVRYTGAATEEVARNNEQSGVAFDILRNLEFDDLGVTIDGPLDGRINFQMRFDGRGDVTLNKQDVRVPVVYRINLDAALLELFNQANLTRRLELQVREAINESP